MKFSLQKKSVAAPSAKLFCQPKLTSILTPYLLVHSMGDGTVVVSNAGVSSEKTAKETLGRVRKLWPDTVLVDLNRSTLHVVK